MAVHNPLSHRLRRRQLPRKGGAKDGFFDTLNSPARGGAYWRSPFVGAADKVVQADIEKVGQFDEGQTGDINISIFHFLIVSFRTTNKFSHFCLLQTLLDSQEF